MSVLRTTHALASDATRAKWRERKQLQGTGFVAIVGRLVTALDRADFDGAEAAIAGDAVYDKDGETIRGSAAIVDSYRASHERAIASLDRIEYRSRLEAIAPGVVRVHFEDRIERGGSEHRYRCVQEMTVGRSKRVEHIVHRDLDGERAALEAFLGSL